MYPAQLNNGDRLFLDLSQNMCHAYFYYGDINHEKYTECFFKHVLKPGDVFVDVGANIGYFTRIASALVGGGVHAFEPMPAAIRLLRENARDLKNVRLHEIALSNERGVCDFSIRKYGDTSSLGADIASATANIISVQTDTIDNVLKDEKRIDVIKIDVEGYEYEVLKGALETIKSKRPLLYFEYIESYVSNRGFAIEDFKSLFAPLGYSLGYISADFPDSPLVSQAPSSYLIAAPHDNRWKIVI